MRYRALLYTLLALVGSCVIAAVLFPVFAKARSYSGPSCLGNVRQLSQAMLIYESDNDVLPAAAVWMDQLNSVLKGDRPYHCPAVYLENRFEYGYAMETKLGGKDPHKLASPSTEPMVFDSFPIGRNAHTNKPIIPGFSRHNGQNIGYADGHAKFHKLP